MVLSVQPQAVLRIGLRLKTGTNPTSCTGNMISPGSLQVIGGGGGFKSATQTKSPQTPKKNTISRKNQPQEHTVPQGPKQKATNSTPLRLPNPSPRPISRNSTPRRPQSCRKGPQFPPPSAKSNPPLGSAKSTPQPHLHLAGARDGGGPRRQRVAQTAGAAHRAAAPAAPRGSCRARLHPAFPGSFEIPGRWPDHRFLREAKQGGGMNPGLSPRKRKPPVGVKKGVTPTHSLSSKKIAGFCLCGERTLRELARASPARPNSWTAAAAGRRCRWPERRIKTIWLRKKRKIE